MADPKTHAQIRKHLATARVAHQQVGDSMDKIEQILSAMKGQPQQPQLAPAPAGQPPNGVSPLGGLVNR